MNLLITGGSGFIGSNLVKLILEKKRDSINKLVNLDALTYAGNADNTKQFAEDDKYFFEHVDLYDTQKLSEVFSKHNITHVIHLAAESHVDNSIKDPDAFINSNIVGTFNLLKACRQFSVKRLHHVSTDEVYGTLTEQEGRFTETTPYSPRNPYSASKAASDFLVSSYYHTYDLPVTLSNCCNNYGPRQHEEKFIPTIISSIMGKSKIPLYGDGMNIRDWIYVVDHCEALWEILQEGIIGETYCVGSSCEKRNIEIIETICNLMQVEPSECIEYVSDRPGHDYRYAIDSSKIEEELQWKPKTSFVDGIRKTIRWYNEGH
tara:strand:+ start:130 stop:1086 length:957 start_codon:yes stop_codon:yes gene_type:complete